VLRTTPVASPINGADVDPRLTLTTTLASLSSGAGLTLTDPLRITNGPHTATVDLSAAQTIEDVLNALNNAGVHVRATINAAGTGIDVVNRLSGSELRISEVGGNTATVLGIRSYTGQTLLSSLNNGRGVNIVAGKIDLTIRDSNGVEYNVNLDGARTVQDVVDLINTATGAAITASLAADGNGIRLVEAAPGAGQLRVLTPDPAVSPSFAAEDLGFAGAETVVGNGEIVSQDVNGVQPRGVFSVLIRLRDALLAGDTAQISIAAEELQAVNDEIIQTHGMVGAASQMFNRRLDQVESDAAETQARLSTLVEIDYAEAITQFTQLQTAAQAGMLSAAQLLNISFLDFLR
jgi:flagellar hook-associated protein 3 FlgL